MEKITLKYGEPVAEFRAWDIRNSKMVYDALRIFETGELVTVNAPYFNSQFSFFDGCKWMQFTGKLDKNKKKIFAGDILQGNVLMDGGNRETMIGVVLYNFELACFELVCDDGNTTSTIYSGNENQYREVIGNIYENNELLNDK